MNDIKEGRVVLEARIVHIAHIADKNLTVSPGSREKLLTRLGAELEGLLTEWSQRGFESNPRIRWARDVLEELKTGCTATPLSSEGATGSGIMHLVCSRRTIRRWSTKQVPDRIIRKLLEAARWAPSSGNRQSVRLVVLRSEVCKQVVVRLKEPFLRGASVIVLVGVDLRVYKATEMRTLAYLDGAAAIENMLLVGHAEGLGCVWSKLDEEDWQFRPNLYFELKKRLRLPNSFLPVSIIGVGWPSGQTRTPPRHEIEAFVRFDDEGFPADCYQEWRPNYFRLRIRKAKGKLLGMVKCILGRSPCR